MAYYYMGSGMGYNANPPPYAKANSLALHLTAKSDPPMPQEFNGTLTVSEWRERCVQLNQVLRGWFWSIFLRLYVIFAWLVSFFLPAPLIMFVNNKILQPNFQDPNFPGQAVLEPGQFAKVRGIDFGMFIGIILAVWFPYMAIYFIGHRKLQGLLASYTANDAARGSMQNLVWTLRDTSIFGQSAIVDVKLPEHSAASVFDPRAYLPPHLASIAPSYNLDVKIPEPGQEPRENFDVAMDRA